MIAPSGLDAVTARIATIQARIGAAHPTAGRRPATFTLDTSTSASGPGATAAAGSVTTAGSASVATVSHASDAGTQRAPAASGTSVAVDGATRAGRTPAGGSASTPRTVAALAARLPQQGQRWAGAIDTAAREAGIEPTLLASLVRHESNFDQGAVSHAGAVGLAQLMPGTADALGVDPHDAADNLAGGARFLREQLDRFGTVELALAAYNAGPNAVTRAGGVPRYAETQAYVPRVMDTWQELR